MKRNRLLLGSLVWIALNATVLVSCSDDDSNKIETSHAELRATEKNKIGKGKHR
ncbi:hypothetical protein UJ101_01207 [Flavobacteriaceae bacterium UJ101]|nr:hypothetical protein UJ101_01207 [Flavobacteriaceae bacterium UJ101]